MSGRGERRGRGVVQPVEPEGQRKQREKSVRVIGPAVAVLAEEAVDRRLAEAQRGEAAVGEVFAQLGLQRAAEPLADGQRKALLFSGEYRRWQQRGGDLAKQTFKAAA